MDIRLLQLAAEGVEPSGMVYWNDFSCKIFLNCTKRNAAMMMHGKAAAMPVPAVSQPGASSANRHYLNPQWHWRRQLRSIVAAASLLLLAACSEAPETPLRVATHPWPGYESLHLAQSLGYFTARQIRLVELTSASQSAVNMKGGAVDAALLTLSETLALKDDGVDLRIMLIMDVSNGADVLMAHPAVATLQDLRGKRIGAETSAEGAVMLDAALTAAGLGVGEVQIADMPANEHVDAYRSGKVDAVVTYEPARTILLGDGAHILFDSSRIPGHIIDVLAVRAGALTAHRDGLRTLIDAHFKALDYLARQPGDAAVRIAPFLRVTPDKVLPQFAGLDLPGLADNQAQMSGSVPPLILSARTLAGHMTRLKLLHSTVNVEGLVDPRLLAQARP